MKSKHLTLPQKKYEYGYELAYQLASEQLARITDIEQQCLKSETQYVDSQKVIVDYLNQSYLIRLADAEVTLANGEDILPVREKILILHYFLQAKGTPLSHKQVTYKELKEGINYFPIFYQRAIKPLVTFFGNKPRRLVDVAATLGGQETNYGDAAVTIHAFSRVPVTLILWKGDEEFAPEGNIMFDSTVSDYLTNDDIHALCEIIAWRLVKMLKAGGDSPGKRHVN